MDRNLSISSFKWPAAFLWALSAWVLANLVVGFMIKNRIIGTNYLNVNLRQMETAKCKSGYFIVLGNSTASRVNLDILARETSVFSGKNGLSLAVRGGLPRTHLFLLERSEYRCVERGGAALLFITPMDLNRNNQAFRWTIRDFFSWNDFFKELLLRGRFLEASYFLQHASMPLAKYHSAVINFLTHSVQNLSEEGNQGGVDRNRVDTKKSKAAIVDYGERYVVDYRIDPYQVDSASRILSELKKRDVYPIIVLPPDSRDLRQLIKPSDFEAYVRITRSLAEEQGAGFLDYVSFDDGTKYDFYDGGHLTDYSKDVFSRRLAADLGPVLSEVERV